MKQFKVYKSSAGSGKTFTLVKEYLTICLQHTEPYYYSKILAITFTNKAAQEMKERVLKMLKAFSSERILAGSEKSMADELKSKLGLSEREFHQRSANILTSILHNYADFNISTIDKFSHQLIRTFARDLNLDLNFKVDLDEEDLLRIVVSQLTEKVGLEKDLTKVLVSHTLNAVDEGRSWDPSSDLFGILSQLIKEDAFSQIDKLKSFTAKDAIDFQKKLNAECFEFERKCISLGDEALNLIASIGVAPEHFYNRAAIPNYFKKLKLLDFSGLENKSNAETSVSQEKWGSSKASATDIQEIEQISGRLSELFYSSEKLMESDFRSYNAKRLIAKSLGLLSLIKEMETQFGKLKQEKNIVPISDFNKKINEVVSTEHMPFIYERLGEKYNHIMIDEFQDTSVMQFLNLMPLIEESLSRGEFNMIVGDAKQAIYRFRGGKVEQFAQMPNYIPEEFEDNSIVKQRLDTLKSNYDDIDLDNNFRSSEHIVGFNNSFFENVKRLVPAKVQLILDGHEQTPSNKNDKGYVEVLTVKERFSEGVEKHLQYTLDSIKSSIEDGFQYRDITILCRTKGNATKVSEFLNEYQIPILSSESLLIASSIKVQLILNVAKYLLEPISMYAKQVVELYFLILGKEEKLATEFEKLANSNFNLQFFLNEAAILIDLKKAKGYGLYELFEKLIRSFGFESQPDMYLQFFMENVFQYQQNESIVLEEFLMWFDAKSNKLSIEMNADENSIQIMTIHKSKGLEFPIVIQPFANNNISPGINSTYLWLDPRKANIDLESGIGIYNSQMEKSLFSDDYSIEEEKRIMDLVNETYVAFTRPSERLYIITDSWSKNSKTFSLPFLLENARPEKAIDTENGYSFGNKSSSLLHVQEIEPSQYELKYHSVDWKNRIKIATASAQENDKAAVQFGILYHELMKEVKTAEEVQDVVSKAKLKGLANEEDLAELHHQIELTVNHPELKALFNQNNETYTERTFFGVDGEIRPDRVIELEDEVVILDYKTGHAKNEDIQQLQHYISCLKEVYNKKVSGKIYYVKEKELTKV